MSIVLAVPSATNLSQNMQAAFPVLHSDTILKDFLNFVDGSERTVETYARGIKTFLGYIREKGIDSPAREDIISFRECLRKTHKATTIKTYLAGLRRFFSWTEVRGLWSNISTGVKGVKLDKGFKKDCLTSSQVRELLASIDTATLQGKRDYALIALMVTTGLRDIEVSRACIGDMKTVGDCKVIFIHGKGRQEKGEFVKISSQVEKAIRIWLSEREEVSESDALFCSLSNRGNGKKLTTRSISRIVKDALRRINLDSDRLTAHSLRHTSATLNLIAGGTLEETQQLLRHASIVTTQIYAHHLNRMQNNSENRISDKIFGED